VTEIRSPALIKAHHAIRNEFSTAIARFFNNNRDILEDPERMKATTHATLTLMEHILAITSELEQDILRRQS
jgi:hypothetical protein